VTSYLFTDKDAQRDKLNFHW